MIDIAKEVLKKKGLKVIESDVYDIAQRISAYDPNLVTTWNPKQEEYQVYDCRLFPHIMMATWHNVLDRRLLERVRRADGRTEYGTKAKLDEVQAEHEKKELDEKKEAHDLAQSVKSELKGMDKGQKIFHF